ncbi:MAG: glutamate--cysteine ligase [Spirochaetota bacterium]
MFDKQLQPLVQELQRGDLSSLKSGFLHGLERESMRINRKGALADTPHPLHLGSAFTNPKILTDFSESQLEYVTAPHHNIGDALHELDALQRFTVHNLDQELLWPFSMPPRLPEEEAKIPLAYYGTSAAAKIKTLYRKGLGYRYGRRMQTISGVHYNISFPKELLQAISQQRYGQSLNKQTQADIYLGTIRNFTRYAPVILYLFGASPAIDNSFANIPEPLEALGSDSHYVPAATTLRLSEIGYTSSIQDHLTISLNSLEEYIKGLCYAVNTTYPPFERFNANGENQLNDHYLQIENEYYALIRPKQTPRKGETVLDGLKSRGIEYLEIRCIDIDPFVANGVSSDSLHFTQLLLFYLALQESPAISPDEKLQLQENQKQTVWYGRSPELSIFHNGKLEKLSDMGLQLCDELQDYAKILDNYAGGSHYQEVLGRQKEKFVSSQKTPAAKFNRLILNNGSFLQTGLEVARNNWSHFHGQKQDSKTREQFEKLASQSLFEQRKIELENKAMSLEPPKVCNGNR